MSNKLGWIGLGRMGEAMVKRLMAGGHKVDVWNRTASKAEPLVAYGASIASSKAALANRRFQGRSKRLRTRFNANGPSRPGTLAIFGAAWTGVSSIG